MHRQRAIRLWGALALSAVPIAGFAAAVVTYAAMTRGVREDLRAEAQLLIFAGLTSALAGLCVMLAAVATPIAVRAWRSADVGSAGRLAVTLTSATFVAIVVAVVYFLYQGMLPQTDPTARRLRALLVAGWAGIYMIPVSLILRIVMLPAANNPPPLTPATRDEIAHHQARSADVRAVLISMSLVVSLATAATVALLALLASPGEFRVSVLWARPVVLAPDDVNSFGALYGIIYATGLVFAYVPARLAVESAGRSLIDRAHPLPPSNDETFSAVLERRGELSSVLGVERTSLRTLESSIALLAPLVTGLVAPLLD